MDEYDGDHDIPPEVARQRLSWLIGEFQTGVAGARTALDVLAPLDRLRDLAILHTDRRDEWKQWERYARPRSRIGRWAYAVGVGLARWARVVG